MYCSHCGKEIDDDAVICPKCGCKVGKNKESNVMGLLGFIFSLVALFSAGIPFISFGIAGLVLSIIGMVNAKKKSLKKGLAITGLVLSIISICGFILQLVFSFFAISYFEEFFDYYITGLEL
ncbi:MAG: zinc-ribbon domain-containing protein [Clostridia bacterium]|nr:zinc-ribbon domain-containing protein [Clostridia bacterium]